MGRVGTPSRTARLRMPRSALLAVGIFAVCVIPVAAVHPGLLVLLALPALAAGHVWRSGVDLDRVGVTVRAAVGSTKVAWADVAGVQVRGRGELWLVRRDGVALRLPALRVSDLTRLSAASQGRLGPPNGGSSAADPPLLGGS